ncbi:hypothetical protein C8J57DRAFT_1241887 [Mycena rebaudengoi]|nr:hypothetical protein C8J57DRAFT_1241887 [Mycena rebaudengoi]
MTFDPLFARHLKISPEDYPVRWEEKGHHPDDYQILSAPLTQEFFVSPHRRRDDLFWFRTSFRVGKEKFLPMSFLIWDWYHYHWAASSYLHLTYRAYELLESYHPHIEPDEARDVMASDQGITDLYQDSPARLEQCGDKVCWVIAVQASGINTRTPTQTFASLSPG